MKISERREAQFRQLASLRGKDRKTFDECAAIMSVSARTLKRWSRHSEFIRVWQELQREWRESAQALVDEAGQIAVAKMIELAQTAKSQYVQFQAAAKLGDWAGLGQREVKEETDDRSELAELFKLIESRKQQQINVYVQQQHQLPPQTVEGDYEEITETDTH